MDTLADKDLLAEAKRASLEINPLSGQAVVTRVATLYATPTEIIDRARAGLAGGPER